MSLVKQYGDGYWDFRSGHIDDLSSNGNDGSFTSTPFFSTNGLNFDGVDDAISVGATSQTIKSVIVLMNPRTTTEDVLDLDAGTHTLEFSTGTLTATGFATPTRYVDGLAGTTVTTASTMVGATTATGFAADNLIIGNETLFFEGDIQAVLISTTELTATLMAQITSELEKAVFPASVYNTANAPLKAGTNPANMTGSYIMNRTGAGLTDLSGNGRDYTPVLGTNRMVDDRHEFGKMTRFPTSVVSDYYASAGIVSDFFNADAKTMVCWYRPTAASTEGATTSVWRGNAIIADSNSFMGLHQTNVDGVGEKIWAYNWDGSQDRVGFDFTVDTWYRIVYTHDGTTLRIYAQGTEQGNTASGDTQTTTGDVRIGWGNDATTIGDLAGQVEFYDRCWSAGEVLADWTAVNQAVEFKTDWGAEVTTAAVTSGFVSNTPLEVTGGQIDLVTDSFNGIKVKSLSATGATTLKLHYEALDDNNWSIYRDQGAGYVEVTTGLVASNVISMADGDKFIYSDVGGNFSIIKTPAV